MYILIQIYYKINPQKHKSLKVRVIIKIRLFWLVKQLIRHVKKSSTFKTQSYFLSQLDSKSYIDPMTLLDQWKFERESLRPPFWNLAVIHFFKSHIEPHFQRAQYHEGHENLELLLKQILNLSNSRTGKSNKTENKILLQAWCRLSSQK